MITNTGKSILAKYLIGQAPAYASYVAIGCGAKPLATNQAFGDYSDKKALDFEMFRVPITSRGYVNEDGINKIVLTAELPTDERYEISEVGIFSAGSNPSAGAYDSRTLLAFTVNENWEYHNVMMRGDSANLQIQSNHLVPATGSNHIHLLGTALDFNRNAPTDEIKLAFSVISKDPDPSIIPDEVRILLEFAESDSPGVGEWARFEVVMPADDYSFANNRYYVITKQLQELYRSTGFTWNNVTIVKIYTTVIKNNLPSDDFYVGLDAVRFENVSTTNPVYGLTGYTVLKNTNAETIIKAANTTNYIEFRFAMDVQ